MKKIILLAMVALMGITTVEAGSKTKVKPVDPRGLFRMQKLSFENGKEAIDAPFEQYKYCGDSITMQISIGKYSMEDFAFYMENNDRKPLNYTGMQKKSKTVQIYDTSKDAFTLRWYNNRMPNNNVFPYNSYTNEYYSRENILLEMANATNMLELNFDKDFNKFCGIWKRRGLTQGVGETSKVYEIDDMYKIYTPDKLMVIYNLSANKNAEHAICEVVGVKYYDDSMIKEMFGANGSPCIIKWIDSSTFTLTYINHGRTVTEVWDRSGLPQSFQTLFGTNEPISNKKADTKMDTIVR